MLPLKVALATSTSLLALLATELALRAFSDVRHPYAHGTTREWWESLAPPNRYVPQGHVEGVRTFAPDLEVLPGLTPRVSFTSNAFGFRSPRLASIAKPEGTLRVFALGGSTTECLYLDDRDAWPEVLQRRLAGSHANVDVVNAGHSGDMTRDHIGTLAHRVVPFEPDVVLLLVGTNDMGMQMADDYSILRHDARSIVTTREPSLRELALARLADFSHVARLAVWARRRVGGEPERNIPVQDEYGHWVDVKRKELRDLPLVHVDVARYPTPEYAQNLRSLLGIARENGAQVVLLTQPAIWGAVPGGWEELLWVTRTDIARLSTEQAAEILERFNDVTRAVAAEEGVALVDLARELPKSPELYYDDVHFTVAGAKAVGEAAAPVVAALLSSAGTPAVAGTASSTSADRSSPVPR